MAFDFGAGAGGFLSEGGESAALLLTTQLAYRLTEAWNLGLVWDAKVQPWKPGGSLFHTAGLGVRWTFFRGLYADARLGPAFSYLREDIYQQAHYGVGWGARLGYAWTPGVVGLNAAVLTNMRYVGALYTDIGLIAGLQLLL